MRGSDYRLTDIAEAGSNAGYFGASVIEGIRSGWTIETVVLFARMAAHAGNRALYFAGVSYND